MRQSEPRASVSGQIPLKIAIDVATVAYPHHNHEECFVTDLIDDTVVSYPKPQETLVPSEGFGLRGTRIIG